MTKSAKVRKWKGAVQYRYGGYISVWDRIRREPVVNEIRVWGEPSWEHAPELIAQAVRKKASRRWRSGVNVTEVWRY